MDKDALKKRLSAKQWHITQEGGTEYAFSHPYYEEKSPGMYHCVCCGQALFSSEAKYASGSGWPSYWEPASKDAVTLLRDESHGMVRTEVRCGACNAHLGHLFDDGPEPTGLRYCINGGALDLKTSPTD